MNYNRFSFFIQVFIHVATHKINDSTNMRVYLHIQQKVNESNQKNEAFTEFFFTKFSHL